MVKKVRSGKSAVFSAAAFLLISFASIALSKDYRIGVAASNINTIDDKWLYTAEYLSDQIPEDNFSIVPLSYNDLVSACQARIVDFTITDPALLVYLEEKHGSRCVATLAETQNGQNIIDQYSSTIFCMSDRYDIQKLADLRNKRIATIDSNSFAGWLMAKRELLNNGIDPYKNIQSINFTGSEEAVIEAVKNGSSDIGIVPSGTLEKMHRTGLINLATIKVINGIDSDELKMLHSTQTYPHWGFSALAHITDETARSIAVELMGIAPQETQQIPVQWSGWTIKGDYQKVRDCLKSIHFTPYEAVSTAGGQTFFQVYYWPLIIIAVIIAITLIIAIKTWDIKDKFNSLKTEHENEIVARINDQSGLALSNLAKSRFIANMGHEIRTPMNAIIGFCDLMSDYEIDHQLRSYVQKIRTSSRSLLHLINDIIDFSKMEAGKLDVEPVMCDVKQMIKNVEAGLKNSAKEKGIEFKLKQEGSIPASIITDPFRLNQCFTNLGKNAIEFTEKGHVHFVVSSFDRDNRSYIKFSIKDTGTGIDRKMLETIFEPFSQASHIISQKYGGPGLGLCITGKLVNLLGGTLDCSSEPGKGSTFTITLPTGLSTKESKMLDAKTIEHPLQSNKDMLSVKFDGRILVAEDSLTNQLLIKIYLEKMGIDVDIVENGALAVEKAQSEKYDLILMDMLMPEMDGYQAVSILKKQGCAIPIVALTANAMKGDLEKCLEAGCDEYISKPIDRSILTNVLRRYLKVAFDSDERTGAPGYHRSLLIKRIIESCGGDEETARIAIAAFIKDGPLCIRSMEKALDQENFNDISLYANRLKIASTHILAEKLQKKTEDLENAAKKSDFVTCQDMYSQTKEQFDKALQYLSPEAE
ncbi:MAG: PhnD/SsuA/transferrin family substrate-binding protein [Sedimentisphaeraceae bacterium JB056]